MGENATFFEYKGKKYPVGKDGRVIVPGYGSSHLDDLATEDPNDILNRLAAVTHMTPESEPEEQLKNADANKAMAKINAEKEKIAASITR